MTNLIQVNDFLSTFNYNNEIRFLNDLVFSIDNEDLFIKLIKDLIDKYIKNNLENLIELIPGESNIELEIINYLQESNNYEQYFDDIIIKHFLIQCKFNNYSIGNKPVFIENILSSLSTECKIRLVTAIIETIQSLDVFKNSSLLANRQEKAVRVKVNDLNKIILKLSDEHLLSSKAVDSLIEDYLKFTDGIMTSRKLGKDYENNIYFSIKNNFDGVFVKSAEKWRLIKYENILKFRHKLSNIDQREVELYSTLLCDYLCKKVLISSSSKEKNQIVFSSINSKLDYIHYITQNLIQAEKNISDYLTLFNKYWEVSLIKEKILNILNNISQYNINILKQIAIFFYWRFSHPYKAEEGETEAIDEESQSIEYMKIFDFDVIKKDYSKNITTSKLYYIIL